MMMQVGMLWFDDTPRRPLNDKIELAVQHYREKHGKSPNVCYVHPKTLAETAATQPPIPVLTAQDILPYHFWLGIEDLDKAPQASARRATSGHRTEAQSAVTPSPKAG